MDKALTDQAATDLLRLWLGAPADRAQVMPHLSEMNRFSAVLVVVNMIERLRNAPSGDESIPSLLEALEEAAWRYSS